MFRQKVICGIFLFYLIMAVGLTKAAAAENDIKLIINNREISGLTVPPTMYQNSVLVPAREVFENMDATVDWVAEDRAVYIYYKDQMLVMTIENKTAMLNGIEMEMPIPPRLINGKTMIPLRFPAECFGFEVSWRAEERAAYIDTPMDLPESSGPVITLPDDGSDNIESGVSPLPPVTVDIGASVLAKDVSSSELTAATYPETSITALLTPRETLSAVYTIVAASSMSEIQKFLLSDNRLVIDIYNAKCAIDGPFYVDASCPVSAVRASQFMNTPMVTRVVFDITGAAEYSVSLSADRTSLTVSFAQNVVTGVSFASTGVSDAITITGNATPVVNVYPMTNPDRILIYVANTVMATNGDNPVNGAFITHISIRQQEEGLGCVEALVSSFSSYDMEYSENSVTVRFYPNTYQNITYDRLNHVISIPKASGLQMDINVITHKDDYTNYRYFLTLPVNAETALGYGEFIIQDGYIHSLVIARETGGMTQLVVNEARVLAFKVEENADYYLIKACLPRELYPRIVVIDPGHGGSDPGTINSDVKEKDINLSITLKLMQLLDNDPNIKAYATRMADVTFVRDDRPFYANAIGDLFVSVHANAATNNTSANGTEIWYWPHDNDIALGFTCQQLAEIMRRHLVTGLGSADRGIKSDNLIVLRDTTIPAVLCETGFMTNAEEVSRLCNESYQWQAAFAIYQGICEAFTRYVPSR